MRAAILAAGRGERLLPFTKYYPKPLSPILGKPLLEYTIQTLKQAAVDLIIVTGYLSHTIKEYFGDGAKFHVKIRYVHNPAHKHGNATSLHAPYIDINLASMNQTLRKAFSACAARHRKHVQILKIHIKL